MTKNVRKYIQGKQAGLSKKDAALAAGYSLSTANSAVNIERTDEYQSIVDNYLPDDKLLKKHQEFLDSESEHIGVKALDMAYKLKNKYGKDGVEVTVNVLNNYLKDRGV